MRISDWSSDVCSSDLKSLERATCIRFNAARSSGGCHLELARASPRRAGQPVQRAEDGFPGGAQSISRNAGAVSAHSEFHDFMKVNLARLFFRRSMSQGHCPAMVRTTITTADRSDKRRGGEEGGQRGK